MKAIGLFSGGLDSTLAIKLMQEQGIEVIALSFISHFFGNKDKLKKLTEDNGINLKIIDISEEYLDIVKKPKHGYGKNMNPCIDCKIFMLKKAKDYAKKIGAKFVFTGEVIGQRPMSQRKEILRLIEKEAGLRGKLLRPLSAKLLEITEAEKRGWINGDKLFSIQGRTREKQFELAKKYQLSDYTSPAGGCLLTYREYSNKLRDLFKNKKKIDERDILLLKIGRHFRFGKNKIIIGRNEEDNKQLLKLKQKSDFIFEVKKYMGPITLLQGIKTKKAVELAAALTVRYSDVKTDKAVVEYRKDSVKTEVTANKLEDREIEKLRII